MDSILDLPGTFTPYLSSAENLTRLPIRVTINHKQTPDGALRVAGMIRSFTGTTVTLDLFAPLIGPQQGASVVLEVMSSSALLQSFATVLNSPNPQSLVLKPIGSVHAVQRRRHPRSRISGSALMVVDGTGAMEWEASLVNISGGGCALTVPDPIAIDAMVTIDLSCIGLTPATVRARVVRRSATPDGRWEMGLAFVHMPPQQEEELSRICRRLLN